MLALSSEKNMLQQKPQVSRTLKISGGQQLMETDKLFFHPVRCILLLGGSQPQGSSGHARPNRTSASF